MNENVNVCITPKGEKPVLHFSQFDNKNIFTVTVLADDGESAAVLTGLDIELRLRKTDSHVVTIAPESVADNVITFKTTEQMCACCGQNIASVVLMKDDMIISTLDIIVDIQRDILSGGLTSESDIRNLTTQIEQIVPEVLGDDYYTKTEVDELIDDIPTFDPTNYYNKSDVDGLLADKADSDDVYNKTETDNLLMQRMGNIEFTVISQGSYPIISFNSLYNAPIIDIEAEITTSTSTIKLIRTGVNLWDEQTRKGYYKTDGTFQSYSGNLATVNPIKVMSNTNYRLLVSGGTGAIGRVCWYDVNGNFISTQVPQQANVVLTSPANAYYLNFDLTGSYGTTYGNNVAVLYPSTQTSYEPYNGQIKTITLDTPVSSGTIDFTRGTVNDSGNIITFTPVTVDALLGVNNVFIDVGNMSSLTYVSDSDYGLMELLNAYTMR